MKADALINELKRKHSLTTDRQIAEYLGMGVLQLSNWRRRNKQLSARQIANAIEKSSKAAIAKAQRSTIRPIVEFFPVTSVESARGAKFELFPAGKEDNPLHIGLRERLSAAFGIYVFYDTRGRAIYAGKAKNQSLWNEMKSAFNRDRATQTVYRVRHPQRRQSFVPAHRQSRQPIKTALQLNDMAAYISVYEIDKPMIDELEALIVRAFANDLLNARMERFEGVRRRSNKNTASRKGRRKAQ